MYNIQAYADKLNLKQTKIQRYMMDFEQVSKVEKII